MSEHWGEMKNETNYNIPDVKLDIESSMNRFCLDEFDADDDFLQKTETIKLDTMDPLMLYAISLHKEIRKCLAKNADLKSDNKKIEESDDSAVSCPEMPELSVVYSRTVKPPLPENYVNELPELGSVLIRQILKKCLATMLAHLGYELSYQLCLDILTDLLEEFFKKVCTALKTEQEQNHTEYPDNVDKVLIDLGIGGINGLHDYYQSRIIKYIEILQNRYKKIYADNKALENAPPSTENTNKVVRVKIEKEDDLQTENIVHFSSTEGEYRSSILETGYELLDKLEANEKYPTDLP